MEKTAMRLEWKAVTSQSETKGFRDLKKGENHIVLSVPKKAALKSVKGTVPVSIAAGEKIFMNGYQTWTLSPEYTSNDRIRGMHRIPRKINEIYAFDRYGDYHFVDYPFKKGITHGESWCYFRKGDTFRLFASLDENPGYTLFQYDAEQHLLTIERDCAGLQTEGDFHAFDLYYAEGSEQEVFDGWFAAMQIKPRTREKLCGYSSWYNRYQNINEPAIEQDLQGCQNIFEPGDLFQIDDGWEPYVGDWLEEDHEKFPGGMKKMADEIHHAGFKAGLWLAPFVAEEKSKLYAEHQDWFLKVDGLNWRLGSNWSGFYSLDLDNPQVINYIHQVFDRVLNEWGYDLVKLDFLYGAAPFGNDHETRAGRMIRAMNLLRECCGDKLILGCGVPVMPAFGLVDYCRISCDVSLNWDDLWFMKFFHRERTSTKNAVTNIVTRRELNNRAYGSDPDVFFLRNENIKLTEKQKNDLAVLDALLGNVFLTSDDPGSYTEEMKKNYQKYRKLTKAKVLHVMNGASIYIEYELDGETHSVSLF